MSWCRVVVEQQQRTTGVDIVADTEDARAAGDGVAHHGRVGQPHTDQEGPVAAAEQRAAQLRSEELPLGPPGPRFNWRSPFFVGLAATAGAAVTYGAIRALALVSGMLLLIGVAFFVSLGLEPAVSWLVTRGLRRWAAVSSVLLVTFVLIVGSLAAAIPALAQQAGQFIDLAPRYIQRIQEHSSWIGQFNERFHVQQRITDSVNGVGGSALVQVAKAVTTVFGGLADLLIVTVLTVYFLVELPRIRGALYLLVPNSRRPRAILIGDEIYARVGAFVLGNVAISVIAGVATFVWLVVFDVPYPVLLAALVALLDLIPFGSSAAGFIVAAVALTVSVPVSLATVAFYLAFRIAEDYLLVPKIVGRAVKLPAVATLLAVLIGGALSGLVGALISIPIAAAIQLLARAVLLPRLDAI
jgi:predicted PurR-regulated permease PerM